MSVGVRVSVRKSKQFALSGIKLSSAVVIKVQNRTIPSVSTGIYISVNMMSSPRIIIIFPLKLVVVSFGYHRKSHIFLIPKLSVLFVYYV